MNAGSWERCGQRRVKGRACNSGVKGFDTRVSHFHSSQIFSKCVGEEKVKCKSTHLIIWKWYKIGEDFVNQVTGFIH